MVLYYIAKSNKSFGGKNVKKDKRLYFFYTKTKRFPPLGFVINVIRFSYLHPWKNTSNIFDNAISKLPQSKCLKN
jgi:hypothetical protein